MPCPFGPSNTLRPGLSSSAVWAWLRKPVRDRRAIWMMCSRLCASGGTSADLNGERVLRLQFSRYSILATVHILKIVQNRATGDGI